MGAWPWSASDDADAGPAIDRDRPDPRSRPGAEKWPEALAAVVALLQASRGPADGDGGSTPASFALEQVGHDPGTAKLYVEHYCHVDPRRALALSYPALKAMISSEHFSARFCARDEYFDYARRSDIGDVVGITTRATRVRGLPSRALLGR